MNAKEHPDLDQLAGDYDIRAELAGRDDARVFMARRRSDDRAVLITVFHAPAGDRGNALSHLASDAGILSNQSHPSVLPVQDGRWAGVAHFAVITDRPAAPTLEEVLTRREEAFEFPRIASVLRQVNSALEWARANRVVHRVLRPDAIHLDTGSDRALVSFAAGALPANGMPGAVEDAASIARLARVMLTRSPIDSERAALPLADVRPGLPRRVVEQTEALLRLDPEASAPAVDPREYIAAIAMAEELKRGEVECDRTIAAMTEEQRATREQLAAERQAHEADLAEQSQKFAEEKEQAARAFAREKEEATRAMARERDELLRTVARERDELQRAAKKEREQLMDEIARERRAIEKERARVAKERSALERNRDAFERESAKGRAQIASKIAALNAHASLYDHTAELPAVADRELPPSVAFEPAWETAGTGDAPAPDAFVEFAPDEPYDEIVEQEPDIPSTPLASPRTADAVTAETPTHRAFASAVARPAWWRRAWARRSRLHLGIAAAALLGIVGASALAVSRDRADVPVGQTRVEDSAAGQVAQPPIVIRNLAPTTEVEAMPERTPSRRASRADRVPVAPEPQEAPASEVPQEPLLPFPLAPLSSPGTTTSTVPTTADSAPRDSAAGRDSTLLPPRPVGIPLAPPRRDSVIPAPIPAVPTLPPRDTIRPDSGLATPS